MAGPSYCALLLPLDGIEALLGDLRRSLSRTPADPVPAHVTIASPLPLPSEAPAGFQALRDALSGVRECVLTFEAFARFEAPGVLYLKPSPVDPLLDMAERAFRCFPGSAPEFAEHVFHATVAQAHPDLDFAERSIRDLVDPVMPITERVVRTEVYAKLDGRWSLQETIPLSPGP